MPPKRAKKSAGAKANGAEKKKDDPTTPKGKKKSTAGDGKQQKKSTAARRASTKKDGLVEDGHVESPREEVEPEEQLLTGPEEAAESPTEERENDHEEFEAKSERREEKSLQILVKTNSESDVEEVNKEMVVVEEKEVEKEEEEAPENKGEDLADAAKKEEEEDKDESDKEEKFELPTVDVPGFDFIGGPEDNVEKFLTPPAQERNLSDQQREFERLPDLAVTEATTLLAESSGPKTCCFRQKPQKAIAVSNVQRCVAWHYSLDSFVETRRAVWRYEPYQERCCDVFEPTNIVDPWNIDLQPDAMFEEHEKEQKVPHTSLTQPCHHCHGRRTIKCSKCRGRGTFKCTTCHGSGKRSVSHGGLVVKASCPPCAGVGRRRCATCRAKGALSCPTCLGRGVLLFSVHVRAHWFVKSSYCFYNHFNLPMDIVQKAKGHIIMLEEQEGTVSAITNFMDDEKVSSDSEQLIASHLESRNGRIVRQRHILRAIPVFKCTYSAGGSAPKVVLVSGSDHNVHWQDQAPLCILL